MISHLPATIVLRGQRHARPMPNAKPQAGPSAPHPLYYGTRAKRARCITAAAVVCCMHNAEVHHAEGVSILFYRGRSLIIRLTGHVGSAVVQLRGPRQCTCHALRHCVRRARRLITGAARRLRCTQPGRRAPARLLPARCGGRRPGTCGAPRCLNLHLVRRENRGVRTAETTGLAAGGLWRT